MSTSASEHPRVPAPEPLIDPGRRLTPSPARDRPWRVLITLIGSAIVLAVVLALAAATTAGWLSSREYSDVPAVTLLGSPETLTLSVRTGDVRVLPSAEVTEVTLALVSPGETTVSGAEGAVRADVRHRGGARPQVEVRQPDPTLVPPWTGDLRDVLLLVPAGLDLDLDLRAESGDVRVEGDFAALRVRSDYGGVQLEQVTAPGELTATTQTGDIDADLSAPLPAHLRLDAQVGDVDLQLPADATSRITLHSETGDLTASAPGTALWRVTATSSLGDTHVDPDLRADADAPGTLTATTELGSVTITR